MTWENAPTSSSWYGPAVEGIRSANYNHEVPAHRPRCARRRRVGRGISYWVFGRYLSAQVASGLGGDNRRAEVAAEPDTARPAASEHSRPGVGTVTCSQARVTTPSKALRVVPLWTFAGYTYARIGTLGSVSAAKSQRGRGHVLTDRDRSRYWTSRNVRRGRSALEDLRPGPNRSDPSGLVKCGPQRRATSARPAVLRGDLHAERLFEVVRHHLAIDIS